MPPPTGEFSLLKTRTLVRSSSPVPGLVRVSSSFRFPAGARQALAKSMVEAVDKLGNRLVGGFAVVEPGRVRVVERK